MQQPIRHDSGHKHVAGEAIYIDDMPEPEGLLHGCLGLSQCAHGIIDEMDLSRVRASPGVMLVLTADDVPGVNDVSPVGLHDEPVFPTSKVMFYGQPLFAVIARTRDEARLAATKAKVVYDEMPAALDVEAARAGGMDFVTEPLSPGPWRYRRGACGGAAPHQGLDEGRRPGAFLSRRTNRARHPRRGRVMSWSIRRPSIRAKFSIWSPMSSVCPITP